VSEIMPANREETRALEERLEVPVDNVLGVEMVRLSEEISLDSVPTG
jgi:hypothetical protein